jgi:hypothetical protein
MEELMYRASLAAAVLGVGALLTFGPAHAAPPPEAGIILAQWGGPGPWAGDPRGHCWQLRQQLDQLRVMRDTAAPWDRPGIEPGIIETRHRLHYECPGF